MRPMTPAELRERRELRKKRKKIRHVKNKGGTPLYKRKVIVCTISLRPELKYRAERDIGKGNFSKAVQIALTEYIYNLDKKKEHLV